MRLEECHANSELTLSLFLAPLSSSFCCQVKASNSSWISRLSFSSASRRELYSESTFDASSTFPANASTDGLSSMWCVVCVHIYVCRKNCLHGKEKEFFVPLIFDSRSGSWISGGKSSIFCRVALSCATDLSASIASILLSKSSA